MSLRLVAAFYTCLTLPVRGAVGVDSRYVPYTSLNGSLLALRSGYSGLAGRGSVNVAGVAVLFGSRVLWSLMYEDMDRGVCVCVCGGGGNRL